MNLLIKEAARKSDASPRLLISDPRLAVSETIQGSMRTSRNHTHTRQGTCMATQREDRAILPNHEIMDAIDMVDPVS